MKAAAGIPIDDAGARPWLRAFAWLCFLAPFFYVSYGTANWLASQRADVPSVVFAWEHRIPFLGWTIFPYWSINGFYALSLFLCSSVREVDTLGRRLLTAQIVAVTCFVLFPLRLTFTQPATDGIIGFLFATLNSFDKPFNQAPSLHIALLVILWAHYAHHVPRVMLWPLHVWFVLVAISVLTTYQHHFIDLPTGALLGMVCLWLWPDHGPSPLAGAAWATGHRLTLALRYGSGALIFLALASLIGGWGLWLLWPALSLTLVSLNYGALGVAGFQKGSEGRTSLAARFLLAPYLFGAWVNSRLWTRTAPADAPIADGVALGRLPSARDTTRYARIIDLSAELPGGGNLGQWQAFPMLDLIAPDPVILARAAAAIEEARKIGPTLVCCALGYSRSAAAVALWLVTTGREPNIERAIEHIRRARPRVVLDRPTLAAIVSGAAVRP